MSIKSAVEVVRKWAAVIAGVAIGGTLAVIVATISSPRVSSTTTGIEGPEVRLVFIGSARCPACRRRDLREAVAEGMALVRDSLSYYHLRGRTVGVAVDDDVQDAWNFLRGIGNFDELVVGGGWLNLGAARYIWSGSDGYATVPQILIVARIVESMTGSVRLSEEVYGSKLIGAAKIMDWVSKGAPLGLPADFAAYARVATEH